MESLPEKENTPVLTGRCGVPCSLLPRSSFDGVVSTASSKCLSSLDLRFHRDEGWCERRWIQARKASSRKRDAQLLAKREHECQVEADGLHGEPDQGASGSKNAEARQPSKRSVSWRLFGLHRSGTFKIHTSWPRNHTRPNSGWQDQARTPQGTLHLRTGLHL